MVIEILLYAAAASSSFEQKVNDYIVEARQTTGQCMSDDTYISSLRVARDLATLQELASNPRVGAGSRYTYRKWLERDQPRFLSETVDLADRQLNEKCLDEADKLYRNVIWHFDQPRAQVGIDDVRAARE